MKKELKSEINNIDLDLLAILKSNSKDLNDFVTSLDKIDSVFNIFDDTNNENLYSTGHEKSPSDSQIKLCFDNRILNKGVVKFRTLSSTSDELVYFKFIDNKLMMFSMLTMTCAFVIEEENGYSFKFIPMMKEVSKKLDYFKDIIFSTSYTTLKVLNKFTSLLLEPKEEIKVLDVRRNTVKRNKKSKPKVFKKYSINVDNYKKYIYEKGDPTGRKYNRHVDSWEVRGHWRHYKSGKKVWIEGGVRGDRTKQSKKQTYVSKGEK